MQVNGITAGFLKWLLCNLKYDEVIRSDFNEFYIRFFFYSGDASHIKFTRIGTEYHLE